MSVDRCAIVIVANVFFEVRRCSRRIAGAGSLSAQSRVRQVRRTALFFVFAGTTPETKRVTHQTLYYDAVALSIQSTLLPGTL